MLRTRYMTLLSVGWNSSLHSLLLASLLGSLGNLTTSAQILLRKWKLETLETSQRNLKIKYLEVNGLDDTDSDSLTHVTYGKTTQRREVRERLNAQGLAGYQGDHGCVTRLDEFGVLFSGFASTTIALFLDLGEFASNVGGVAIQHGGVTVTDLARVVQHDDLGEEVGGTLGWVVLGVTGDETTAQLLDGDVLDVETNVVT